MKDKVLLIAAFGEGKDGMSHASIVLRDEWKHMGVAMDSVDFFENGGAGVGISANKKVMSTYANFKLAKKYIKDAKVVYITPKMSLFGFLSCIPFYRLCLANKVPYTLHFHGRGLQQNFHKPLFPRKRMQYYVKKARSNIALTPSLKEEMMALMPEGRWDVVGNFSDLMLKDDEMEQKRKSYQQKPLQIVYMSNIMEGKGIFELIDAVKNDDRFKLKIAGAVFPEEKERFDAVMKDAKNIEYLGFVYGEDKRNLLKESAVFALPTAYKNEAQPISMIEALCLGCVVLTTTLPGIVDTLGESYPQSLYIKKDVENLKVKLTELYDTNCKEGEVILDRIKDVQRPFSVPHYAKQILDLTLGQ